MSLKQDPFGVIAWFPYARIFSLTVLLSDQGIKVSTEDLFKKSMKILGVAWGGNP